MNGDNAKIFIAQNEPKRWTSLLIISALALGSLIAAPIILYAILAKTSTIEHTEKVNNLTLEDSVTFDQMLKASNYYKKYLQSNKLDPNEFLELNRFEKGDEIALSTAQVIKEKATLCLEYMKAINAPETMQRHFDACIKEQTAIRDAMQALQHGDPPSTVRMNLKQGRDDRRQINNDPMVSLCIDYNAAFKAHCDEGTIDEYLNVNLLSDKTLKRVKTCVDAQRCYLLPNKHTLKQALKSSKLSNTHIYTKWFDDRLQISVSSEYRTGDAIQNLDAMWTVDSVSKTLHPSNIDANLISSLAE